MGMKIEYIPTEELQEYENNTRLHSDYDIDKIIKSIKKYGFNDPIGIWKDNVIIEGHGRLLAAQQLGIEKVPCIRLDHLTDKQRREYAIMHNRTAEYSEWDFESLKIEVADLDFGDFDLEEMVIDDFGNDFGDQGDKSLYTNKKDTVQYEITGEKPNIIDLYDKTKYSELMNYIELLDIEEQTKEFLRIAATRFIVFNFKNIAEFYAHSDAEIQNIMEKLALVIIDYEDAIKQGFVKIKEEIEASCENE